MAVERGDRGVLPVKGRDRKQHDQNGGRREPKNTLRHKAGPPEGTYGQRMASGPGRRCRRGPVERGGARLPRKGSADGNGARPRVGTGQRYGLVLGVTHEELWVPYVVLLRLIDTFQPPSCHPSPDGAPTP